MDNQTQEQMQPGAPVVTTVLTQTATIEPKKKSKIWKILGIILIIFIAIFWFLYWLGSQNPSIVNDVQTNNMLTAEKIESLQTSSNDPGGDYFIGTPEEQQNIVSEFVENNSDSDPTYLFIAANTAYRIGEIKEAAFLFYAAQIRKSFDSKRYGMGDTDGNNIQTYWGFLDETTGSVLNPAIMRNPQEFSEVIDMLNKWQVIPVEEVESSIYKKIRESDNQEGFCASYLFDKNHNHQLDIEAGIGGVYKLSIILDKQQFG